MSLKQKLVKEAMDIYEGKSFDSNAQDLSTTLSGSSEGHITAAATPKKEPPATVTPKDPKPKTPPVKPKETPKTPLEVKLEERKTERKAKGIKDAPEVKSGPRPKGREAAGVISDQDRGKKVYMDNSPQGKLKKIGGNLLEFGLEKLGLGFINDLNDAKKKAAQDAADAHHNKINDPAYVAEMTKNTLASNERKKAKIREKKATAVEKKTGVTRGTGPLKREGGKKAPAIPKMKSFEEMVGGGVKGAINSLTPKPPPPKVPFKAGDGVRKNPVKPVVPKTTPKKEAPKPTDKQKENKARLDKMKADKKTTPSFLAKPAVTPAPAKSAMGFTIPKVTPAPAATPVKTTPTKPAYTQAKAATPLKGGLKSTPKPPSTPPKSNVGSGRGGKINYGNPAPAATPAPVKATPKGTTPPRFTSPATPKTTPKKEAPKPTDTQKENKARLDKMKGYKNTTPKKETPKPKAVPKPATEAPAGALEQRPPRTRRRRGGGGGGTEGGGAAA